MSELIEIEGPNLPRELKQFRTLERFSAHVAGETVGELMPFADAMRQAAATDGTVWFAPEGYASAAPYSDPVPSYMSKKKRK